MEASEILSAFVDGEAVEVGELAAVLAAPGARETLIDFLRLRTAVADDTQPSREFVQRMRRRLAGGGFERTAPRLLRLAAALVLTTLATVG
ncbi:MAG TPA: hypothetical protein VEQ10_08175, partial [Vicinamibacteria bacterium]|nr:hypothetical protein [Vicinamibacteria bacterium]